MLSLTSSQQTVINSNLVAYTVPNPSQCDSFDHLLGHLVAIDGAEYKVADVAIPDHPPPWVEGETIQLTVVVGPQHNFERIAGT